MSLSVFGNDAVVLATAAGVEQSELPNPPHIQHPSIQSMVDQLQGHGPCPVRASPPRGRLGPWTRCCRLTMAGRNNAFWTRRRPGRGGEGSKQTTTCQDARTVVRQAFQPDSEPEKVRLGHHVYMVGLTYLILWPGRRTP